ncbi:sensor histidine kinase [Sellimonas intestinalis]|uniref:sensor histidine kinase n=1 Tax=Sellimonas intestinalis TaxID=1653434 RepID=UPI0015ECBF65|nr:HAMP domain-containing sensor histidine kinase [Sellimonas intestinalis]MBA2213274.1 HAMP domain-containing histidine kinase [Sellimonas intestinalis]
MKRLSLKLKLTLLYSLFMTLLTCAALAILFSLSNKEILASTQNTLKKQLHESLKDIEWEDGSFDLDSDFYNLDGGVYLSLYTENGDFLFGRIPYGFSLHPDFSDGQIQTLSDAEKQWYIYDLSYRLDGYGLVFVRGISSVTDAESSFRITLRFAVIVLPLLVVLTAVIGYLFTRRTLRPVRRITETVCQIQGDQDLSRRVELGKGKDEIYQLADTFDQLLTKIESAFQREQQFTSDVSHELRTPVTVILAQCDAILSDASLPAEQRVSIGLIQKKAQNMAQMISQLLLLSRADQGRQQLQPELLNLSELTEMVCEEQAMLSEEKKIVITTQIEPDLFVKVDETFYIRMLVNLISNAISYGKAGGHILVSCYEQSGFFVGQVEDDGIGIAAEDLPHIWERFYRVDSSRSASGHSGLGLSMVKWIVEAHGGTISVKSSPGEGSIFTFLLPMKAE